MKKMIKMSLVAAVAVTGLSSTVAAKPLAEAIKDVDVSGSVVYRYDDKKEDNGKATVNNNYKIGATLKSKVNDVVTATVRVVTGHDLTGEKTGANVTTGYTQTNTGNFATLDTSANADQNPTLQVSQANFTAKVAGATVIAGKQGLTTPWTVAIDSDGQEQTGTGLLALVPAGPVTVAAAVFNQTNLDSAHAIIDGTEDIVTVGVLGKAGMVSFDAWYLDLADDFDTMTLGAKAKVANISLDARYASLDLDTSDKDNSMMYIKASTKVGKIGLKAQFAVTDEEGGLTALDQDAKTTTQAWNTTIHGKADATFFHVAANTDVMSGLNAAINFATVDYKSGAVDMETTEMFAQLTHKMGKNLSTYVRYGVFTTEASNAKDADYTRGRLQVEYKF